MNTVIFFSSVLNLAASALLTLVVFTATTRGNRRRHFLRFLFCITSWTIFYFFWQIADSELMAFWSCVGLIVPATFIPVTFYHLSLRLSDRQNSPIYLWLGYLGAIIATCTAPFQGLVSSVGPKMEFPFWPDAGPFLYLVIAIYIIYVPFSAITLFRGSNKHIGVRSSQIRFVLGSSAIGFVGGFTNFPLWYDINIPPYGNLIVFIYLLMVGYGIYNRRIPGIYVDVFKAVIYLLLAASLSMFYVIGRAVWALTLGQEISQSTYWVQGVAAFFLSSFLFWGIPRVRAWTEHMLELVFRKDKITTVAQLETIPTRLSILTDEDEIFKETCESLSDILNINGAALFSRDYFDSRYQCRYNCGDLSKTSASLEIGLDDPLIPHLSEKPECVVLDQLLDDVDDTLETRLVDLKERLGLAVIVPITAGNDLQGFIFLGAGNRGNLWPVEHVTFLFAVGAQIGLNIRARDLERRANEVDKLVALGTMAAGLAHEIRNPLVSIQTFASLIGSGKNIDQMPEDFRSVLVRDVKRIENIVDGVAAFSRNQKGVKSVNDMNEIIQSSLDIYKPMADEAGVRIETRSPQEEILVNSNFDQLVQVFNNLVENAIHALECQPDGLIVLDVSTMSSLAIGRGRWVEVSVLDNGKGVHGSIIDRIFDPFSTSKDTGSRHAQGGMGLGLAISKRIIENHNGSITVSNIESGGAKFTVSLKLFDSN